MCQGCGIMLPKTNHFLELTTSLHMIGIDVCFAYEKCQLRQGYNIYPELNET